MKKKPIPRNPPSRRHLVTNAMIEGALRKRGGLKALAAHDLGVTRQNVWQRVKNSPHLQQVLREIDELYLDRCEGWLVEWLQEGDKKAVFFFLETKGGERGYSRRTKTDNKLDDEQLESIVAAFGGDPDKLRALRNTIEPAAPGEQGPVPETS